MTIKGSGAWFLAGLVLLDALCILLAMELANHARGVLGFLDTGILDAILEGLWLPATACWIVVIAVLGGYRSADLGAGLREHTSIVNSGFVMGGLLATALYLTRTPLSRVFFFALLDATSLLNLRRLDDDYCDPLELRGDSALGVPGRLSPVRDLGAHSRDAPQAVLEPLRELELPALVRAGTDGERAGYDVKALQIAAAHTSEKMTETYLKQRNVPVADVRLHVPKSA